MEGLEGSASAATIAAAAVAVMGAVVAGITFPVRWVLTLVQAETKAREKAVDGIWLAIDGHRRDDQENQRRIADKIDHLATKADLDKQTEQLMDTLKLATARR